VRVPNNNKLILDNPDNPDNNLDRTTTRKKNKFPSFASIHFFCGCLGGLFGRRRQKLRAHFTNSKLFSSRQKKEVSKFWLHPVFCGPGLGGLFGRRRQKLRAHFPNSKLFSSRQKKRSFQVSRFHPVFCGGCIGLGRRRQNCTHFPNKLFSSRQKRSFQVSRFHPFFVVVVSWSWSSSSSSKNCAHTSPTNFLLLLDNNNPDNNPDNKKKRTSFQVVSKFRGGFTYLCC